MGRPRLGIVTSFFPSLTETFIYREIEGLAAHGVPVRVFSVRRPPDTDVSEEVRRLRRQTHYLLPPRWPQLARAHACWLARRPLRYLSTLWLVLSGRHERWHDRARTLAHFAEGVLVAALARGCGLAHLHAHYASHPATIALTAARLLDIPFSFTGHAYDIWTDRLLLPEKMAACAFAVTCTEAGRRALLAEAPRAEPGRITVVYHGVDSALFRPRPEPSGEFHILSVGRLDRPKGHHLLLVALAALAQEGYRFRATIVGDGPEREVLGELARRLGLAGLVRFAGRVYHEELPAYYQGAHLFVLACYNDAGNQDNLPNVLLEAMACGLPVVSTRFQGIPELIEDGMSGLLVEPQDSRALAAALRRLLDDRELGRRLGRAGRERVVAHFDQASSVARLAALYRRQLDRAKGAELQALSAKPSGAKAARPEGWAQ